LAALTLCATSGTAQTTILTFDVTGSAN